MREVLRSASRFRTDAADGITTFHSFSYGAHYDPRRISCGPIVAINEEILPPGAGYDAHRHSEVEIVTVVLNGALRHQDSTGFGAVVRPGFAQRLSAGTGVWHTERNASATEPLRFLQVMMRSNHLGEPEYAQAPMAVAPGLSPLIAVRADVEVLLLRSVAGESFSLPFEGSTYLHVLSGEGTCGTEQLHPGDAVRADAPITGVTSSACLDALVWFIKG